MSEKSEKKTEILVPVGVKSELCKIFNVSYPTVRSALNGVTDSLLANRIRIAALRGYGGVERGKINELLKKAEL